MAFARGEDRGGWKKPRSKPIDAKERDAILDALRETPADIDGIAARFDLGRSTIVKMAEVALDRRNVP